MFVLSDAEVGINSPSFHLVAIHLGRSKNGLLTYRMQAKPARTW